MDARWQLRLLGGLVLSDGQQQFTRLPSRAITALLARLALWPARAHAREELIELLWPGVALDAGRNRLRQALFTLKGLLEPVGRAVSPVLQADRVSVRVVAGSLACDVTDFERHARAGRVAEARALYGGELLPGFYDEWIDDERARLVALHDRLVVPGVASAPAAPPPAAAPSAPDIGHATLPTYLTRVFGADVQGARLRGQVLAHRLVTVLGPGGSGKTRLAVELAHSLRQVPQWGAAWPQQGDGAQPGFDLVAFVPLVSCATRADMVDTLLASLQVKDASSDAGSDALERLAQALAGRRVLLVLDNFEQLAGLGEPVVAHLAALLPQLHLLVTSRRALGLDGEREFAVAALDLPHAEMALDQAAANPAVALFVDRARAVRADFRLNAPKREAVIELVRELEGMPLAIELAASRVRSFSPADMLALLRRAAREPATGATPRLDLLARSGPRAGLDPRHASMQRVIEWSWRQLTPAQTRLLGALTVFHGGATAQAVRSVHGGGAGEAQLLLDELQSQSLLHSHEALSGELRFSLYEPIREFAAARVDAAAAAQWRARHRAWLIEWAASFGPTPALDAVRAEMPNLLAALASSVADAAPHDAVRLIIALRRTLEDVELPAEGLSRLQAAVEHCTDPLLQSRGHTLLGPMLFTAGRKEDALRHAERGLAGAPADPSLRARALHAVARVRWRSSRQAEGLEAMLDEAQALAEAAGDTEVQASVYALRAFITNTHYRDHAAGIALHIRALVFWETTGNQHAIDSGRYNLAVSVQNAGRHDEALTRLAEIIDSARALQDWRRLSQALNVRGNALSGLRRWPEAAVAFRECIRIAWGAVCMHDLAYGLWNLPRALAHLRQPEAALQLSAFAAQFWTTHFGPLSQSDERELMRVRRLAARQLDAARCEALWTQGQRLATAQAVRLALAEAC